MKKLFILILSALLALTAVGCGADSSATSAGDAIESAAETSEAVERPEPSIHWRVDTTSKYMDDDKVTTLILVQATHDTYARVLLYEKSFENDKVIWNKTMECIGYIGKAGLGREKRGDNKTTIGDFGMVCAFGIKENPGTELEYIDVTEDTYACGDEEFYNQIIDAKETGHTCTEYEHLIDYTPEYNYGLLYDYNIEGDTALGNALFLHCSGANTYTGGCIAVDEQYMVQILKAVDENSRIIIDYAPTEIPNY